MKKIKEAVEYLKSSQTPIITLDQMLFYCKTDPVGSSSHVCCDDGRITDRNGCSKNAWQMAGQEWVNHCIGSSWNNENRKSRCNAKGISCHQNTLCSPNDHWGIVYSTKKFLYIIHIICTCRPQTPRFQNIE